MQKLREEVARRAREKIGNGLRIIQVENGLIFEHRNASHFVAEINLENPCITVPVTAEFRDHPDYDEEQLVDRAMELLRPRLREYHRRGYDIRETDFQPGYDAAGYGDHSVPVFIAFVQRWLDDDEELFDELSWLLERLPAK